jgi:GNAT superfamily N-acetyltransferase
MDIRPLNLTDTAEASGWYAAYAAGATAGRTAPLVHTEKAVLTSLRTNGENPNSDRRAYGAWDGDTCLGAALLELPRKENTHLAAVEVVVPVEFRRHGVGSALYEHVLEQARRAGRRLVNSELPVPAGEEPDTCAGGRFAATRGFETKHTEQRLVLELPVGAAELKTLRARAAPALDAGYRVVSWVGLPPAEHAVALAGLMTGMDEDVPTGELDREPTVYTAERVVAQQKRWLAGGWGILTALALDPAGGAAGYSVLLPAIGTRDAVQLDTFVAREHRGRRLSYLVKTENLSRLATDFPDVRFVHTGTADVNSAMHAVNDEFGFRSVERVHELEARVG